MVQRRPEKMKGKNKVKVKVDGKKVGTWDGIIRIISGDVEKTIFLIAHGTDDDQYVSLDDCLKLIDYENIQRNPVTVIIDDLFQGTVYCFGNYGDGCWYKVGTTQGYV